MSKKYLIVYHLEDNDGCCSAAILKYYLVKDLGVNENDITLFPATYAILDTVAKHDFEEFEGYDTLMMTDISFNDFNNMIKLYEKFGKANFTWIDHHAPVIKVSIDTRYDEKINGVRDIYRSAILNAYKYCFDPLDELYNSGHAPLILRYLSAWDSWTSDRELLDFETVRYVNTGFTSELKLDVNNWYDRIGEFINSTDTAFLNEMMERGRKICTDLDNANEKLVKTAGMGGFTVNGNRSCIVLFTSGGTSSLIFKSVRGQYDNAVCFKSSSTGNITFSMYNVVDNHEFHCGNYLHEKYNGGGHEGAAGATVDFETFTKMLLTKQI